MPLVVKDRVRETSTTTGTGTFTLAGAVTGYQSFSAVGNGNTTYYTIYLQGGNEWEVGIGTYTASGTTLSRDTILASSNGGSAVNFSAGVKDVFVTYPADRSVWYDSATNVTLNALTVTGALAANGGTTIGDASGDAFTINSSAVSTPNGLNFDSNTFVIDAANNRVGIGAASPAYTLDVVGGVVRSQNSGGINNGYLITTNSANAAARNWAVLANSNVFGDFVIRQGNSVGGDPITGTDRLAITPTGQVNIGGNFTSTNNTLQVTGNAAIGYTTAAPTTGLIVAGNVGIGTDSPLTNGGFTTLNISNGSNGGVLELSNGSTRYGQFVGFSGSVQINGYNSAPLSFQTGTSTTVTERAQITSAGNFLLRQSSNAANTSVSFNTTVQDALTLDSSGRLGIGDSAPATKMVVAGTDPGILGLSYIYSTDSATQNKGGQLTFGGSYTGTTSTYFAAIAGRKESVTSGNYDGYLQFLTRNAVSDMREVMRLDSSGNLGLGVTPSAWAAGWAALQIKSGGASIWTDGGARTFWASNEFFDGTNRKYVVNGRAHEFAMDSDGSYQWKVAASGLAGNNISFTQAMTLDASGNLGIGTTSPAAKLDVQGTSLRLNLQSTSNGQYATWKYVGKTSVGAAVSFEQGINITADNAFEIYDNTNTQNVSRYFSGASGYWQWFTNGTERARITAAGDFGIGTTSPARKLDVYGAIQAADASGIQSVLWSQATASAGGVGTNNNFPFTLLTNGSVRATLDTSGNLGLGVTPSAWDPNIKAIDINAACLSAYTSSSPDVQLVNNAFYNGTNWIYKTTNTAGRFRINGNQHEWYRAASGTQNTTVTFTQAMTLDASGRLGIGQTNPTVPLEVAQSAVTYTQLRLANLSAGNNGGQVTFAGAANADVGWIKCNYPGEMLFGAYNTSVPGVVERARITSGGDFGVGTTTVNVGSYGRVITVAATAAAYGAVEVSGTTGGAIDFQTSQSTRQVQLLGNSSGFVMLTNGGAGLTERARIDASGNLLVGTTTAYKKLTVDGNASIANTLYIRQGATDYGLIYANGNALGFESFQGAPITWATGAGGTATERARITSTGNVGIGTNDPNSFGKLAVVDTNRSGTALFVVRDEGTPSVNLVSISANAIGTALAVNSAGNTRVRNIGLGDTAPTTSGTGITFPATASPSSDANTLDDYEEGTFDPEISAAGGAPTITYGAERSGYYVKVGQIVTCWIVLSTTARTGGSGNLLISNLPFVANDGQNAQQVYAGSIGTTYNLAHSASYAQFGTRVPRATSAAVVFEFGTQGGTTTDAFVPVTAIPTSSNFFYSAVYSYPVA